MEAVVAGSPRHRYAFHDRAWTRWNIADAVVKRADAALKRRVRATTEISVGACRADLTF
jgi:hypothetical protein